MVKSVEGCAFRNLLAETRVEDATRADKIMIFKIYIEKGLIF